MVDLERDPLLTDTESNDADYSSISKTSSPVNGSVNDRTPPSRSVEDDILLETSTVGRNLGWHGAFILVISRVIGSGIFATPGAIFRETGSVGLTLTLWVVGAGIAWAGLAVGLEYGCMLPRSGGTKVYLEFTYRRPKFLASTVMAVYAVLLGFTASNCIVFGEYVLFALRIEPTPLLQKSLAVGLLVAITIIHGCFLRTGIFIQNVLGWIKIALVVFMIFTGLFVVLLRQSSAETKLQKQPAVATWSTLWEGTNWQWSIISKALFQVFYSYAGLENINNVMNEVKNPVRTLKTVAPAGLVTACVLYVLINISYFLVVPLEEIKESGEMIAGLFFERVFGESVGRIILPLGVAISAMGNVMVVTFSLARLNQEIARQGFFPFSRLLASSKPFGAPMGGLIVHLIPSLLVITLPPSGNVYSFILEVEGYPAQFLVLATSFGLLLLRYRRPEILRPYKAWLPAVWLRIVLAISLLAAPFFPPPQKQRHGLWYATYAVVGTSILVFAVLYWYIWTVLLPRLWDYELVEKVEILEDGTSITKLSRASRSKLTASDSREDSAERLLARN